MMGTTPPRSTRRKRYQDVSDSPAAAPVASPSFISSFDGFNLPAPRGQQQQHFVPPSPGTSAMQMDMNAASNMFESSFNQPQQYRRISPNPAPGMTNPFSSASSGSFTSSVSMPGTPVSQTFFGIGRKQSMLGHELLPPASLSPNTTSLALDTPIEANLFDDSPMMLGSPRFDTPATPLHLPQPIPYSLRHSRSRSASESMSGGYASSNGIPPPSPISVARALGEGQTTPPPFLQRRLYGVQDDEGGNSSSGSSSRGMHLGSIASDVVLEVDEQEELEEDHQVSVGLGLAIPRRARETASAGSTSASGSGGEEGFNRVVRRPVSRKPNLLVGSSTPINCQALTELFVYLSQNQNLTFEFYPSFERKTVPPTY